LDTFFPDFLINWWKEHVLAQLSFQQVQTVGQLGISEFVEFDLVMFHKVSFSGWRMI